LTDLVSRLGLSERTSYDRDQASHPFDSEPWVTERYQWLSEHFGIRKNRVIFGEPKYAVSGRWFLEDNLDQALSWAEGNPDGVSMLWNTPNNDTLGHDQLRVYDWEQVLSTVEKGF
jgi:5'(3')-deoxyribonucleotidase